MQPFWDFFPQVSGPTPTPPSSPSRGQLDEKLNALSARWREERQRNAIHGPAGAAEVRVHRPRVDEGGNQLIPEPPETGMGCDLLILSWVTTVNSPPPPPPPPPHLRRPAGAEGTKGGFVGGAACGRTRRLQPNGWGRGGFRPTRSGCRWWEVKLGGGVRLPQKKGFVSVPGKSQRISHPVGR